MPPRRSPKDSPEKQAFNQLMWAQSPNGEWSGVSSWEPRGEELAQALLEVLASGSAIFIRPGSGGRAIGIAIWEGDTKHPATWCYDDEEVNMWAAGILQRVANKSKPKNEE